MDRRQFLKILNALPFLGTGSWSWANNNTILQKKAIPSSGERIPVIGMGTSRTFNVGPSETLRKLRTQVLQRFFATGGRLIDSSPMYGSSEEVVGHGLSQIENDDKLISATKVWTESIKEGKRQFNSSLKLWRQDTIDIYQIHNLLAWQDHLPILREYKKSGKIRYLGITTSHGRRLDELEKVMKTEPLDFVQLTYNLNERWNEERLLPLAKDKGIAIIANRPFQRGDLFDRVKGKKLPPMAQEIGCETWASFFLKWVVSHPAVTCAIPATSRLDHMNENMQALRGPLPTTDQRLAMAKYFAKL